jgi:hypothetical protein
MERQIPYRKLSKKKRRELDNLRRGTWGSLNPVTRKSANPKAYDRRKARSVRGDSSSDRSAFFLWASAGIRQPGRDGCVLTGFTG